MRGAAARLVKFYYAQLCRISRAPFERYFSNEAQTHSKVSNKRSACSKIPPCCSRRVRARRDEASSARTNALTCANESNCSSTLRHRRTQKHAREFGSGSPREFQSRNRDSHVVQTRTINVYRYIEHKFCTLYTYAWTHTLRVMHKRK